jgi:hypothetical protein
MVNSGFFRKFPYGKPHVELAMFRSRELTGDPHEVHEQFADAAFWDSVPWLNKKNYKIKMYIKLLDIRKRVEKQTWHEQNVNKGDKMASIVWTHISAI